MRAVGLGGLPGPHQPMPFCDFYSCYSLVGLLLFFLLLLFLRIFFLLCCSIEPWVFLIEVLTCRCWMRIGFTPLSPCTAGWGSRSPSKNKERERACKGKRGWAKFVFFFFFFGGAESCGLHWKCLCGWEVAGILCTTPDILRNFQSGSESESLCCCYPLPIFNTLSTFLILWKSSEKERAEWYGVCCGGKVLCRYMHYPINISTTVQYRTPFSASITRVGAMWTLRSLPTQPLCGSTMRVHIRGEKHTNLRMVSAVQQLSKGTKYPTSWPMLTSISSAARRASLTATCPCAWEHTAAPCLQPAARQCSAHHCGTCNGKGQCFTPLTGAGMQKEKHGRTEPAWASGKYHFR